MKKIQFLLLFLFSCKSTFGNPNNREETPLLQEHQLTFPDKPHITFRWLLENIPGRGTTVFPVSAFITGTMMAPVGYQTCSWENCSAAPAALLSVGTALWFYAASCAVATCVVNNKPKQK